MASLKSGFAASRKRILASLILLLTALAAPAQAPQEKPAPSAIAKPAAPATGEHDLTAADVEAFLDGLVPMQLARNDIAGATILVVKDGKVLFAKGYGFSNVKKRTPVTVETLFRPGSISKLFTWTAVMQLVERGQLDLDKDVNEYLDFQIPHTFGKPVTLRNLMTHSAGFEESLKDLEVEKPSDLRPLGPYLKSHQPRQIFPPGTVPAYSNYGADLAGYIVQRVSGRPFEDYIEENIFAPLKMKTATFRQKLPDASMALMSDGYRVASGEPEPFELVLPDPGPSGTLSASAADMAPFMMAHLQEGQYQGVRILRPETARLMHSRQFTMDPVVDGMALGFYEENRNGHAIIGHGGDLNFFHSDLHLVTDAGVGFFVSYNSSGKGEGDSRSFLWEEFLDRYFPYSPPAWPAMTDAAKAEMQRAVGTYVPSRRAESTIMSLLWYVLIGKSVSLKADGTLEVEGMDDQHGQPKRWRAIGNLTYGEVNGQKKLVYQPDRLGGVLAGADPTEVFQRVSWSHSKSFLQMLLGFALAIFGMTVVLWPVAAMARKHYGAKLILSSQQARLRLAVKLTCLVNLGFLALTTGLLVYSLQHLTMFDSRHDGWIRLLQLIAWLGVLGTIPVLVSAYVAWRTRASGWWVKIYNTGLALACLGFVWFVATFHLLNFSLKY